MKLFTSNMNLITISKSQKFHSKQNKHQNLITHFGSLKDLGFKG